MTLAQHIQDGSLSIANSQGPRNENREKVSIRHNEQMKLKVNAYPENSGTKVQSVSEPDMVTSGVGRKAVDSNNSNCLSLQWANLNYNYK